MSGQDASEKTHEPSQRKLDQARNKGDVARSTDLVTAGAYFGFWLALVVAGYTAIQSSGTLMTGILLRSPALSEQVFYGRSSSVWAAIITPLASDLIPLFCLPPAISVCLIFAQKAFVFAPSKLRFRSSRISLLANAKNKYGPSGLFEFLKSFAKLSIFATSLCVFVFVKFPLIAEAVHLVPTEQLNLLGRLIVQFVLIIVVVMLAVGAIDFFWQKYRHLQQNRMSHQELKDEHKEAEGDPYLKQERRARAQQIASHQLVSEVKKADVIIVNPTHYAVALSWSRKSKEAPVCVAKGVDAMAAQIREIAHENGVPIHSDPPTARSLYANLDVGMQIDKAHFRAVAVAILFAEEMRLKTKGIR